MLSHSQILDVDKSNAQPTLFNTSEHTLSSYFHKGLLASRKTQVYNYNIYCWVGLAFVASLMYFDNDPRIMQTLYESEKNLGTPTLASG